MEYNEAFNGLRGFAFIDVLIGHLIIFTSVGETNVGQFGVDLFYVLSAYLLTLILYDKYLKKNTLNLFNYWIRRFFRIYPSLTLTLIIGYFGFSYDLKSIFGIFFLYAMKSIFWTIYLEVRYYFIIPLIVLIFGNIKSIKWKIILMAVITLLGFIYHYYLTFILEGGKTAALIRFDIDDFSWEKNIVFINYLPVFLLGSFMAIIVYHLKQSEYDFDSYPLIQGAFTLCMSLLHIPLVLYREFNKDKITFAGISFYNFALPFTFGYIIILLFLNGKNFMTKFYAHKYMAFFGKISYPGYLIHMGFIKLFIKRLGWKMNIFVFVIIFVLTIIFAYLIHITVEQYFIDLTKFWFYEKSEANENKNTDLNRNELDEKNNEMIVIDEKTQLIVNEVQTDQKNSVN